MVVIGACIGVEGGERSGRDRKPASKWGLWSKMWVFNAVALGASRRRVRRQALDLLSQMEKRKSKLCQEAAVGDGVALSVGDKGNGDLVVAGWCLFPSKRAPTKLPRSSQ
jgi:hypothetical protein